MAVKILIAFATNSGSTQEVAEKIGEALRQQGLAVDLAPAQEVRSLEGYQAVVLGAPLYMFRWHTNAHQFLTRQRKALQNMPVAVFALGPWHDKEEELQSAREQLEKALAKHTWFSPLEKTVFVGKFDPQKLKFPYNLIPALKNMEASDERNWDAIQKWAADLASRFSLLNPVA